MPFPIARDTNTEMSFVGGCGSGILLSGSDQIRKIIRAAPIWGLLGHGMAYMLRV